MQTDPNLKAQIISGDLTAVQSLLQRLLELDKKLLPELVTPVPPTGSDPFLTTEDEEDLLGAPTGHPAKSIKDPATSVDIINLDTNKEPTQTLSCLEFILNTLCRNFKLRPKQSAALLANNNQYLLHAIVKGVKGSFHPVVAWY